MPTPTNYVFVDYENVQPTDIELLKSGPFKVKVFLGPNQSKIPATLAITLQPLGESVEYVVLEKGGKNALDFHIAYYLGALSAVEPAAYFHVISKDGGFDSLLQYLKGKKLHAHRATCIAQIPFFKLPKLLTAHVETAIADLNRRKASAPRTQKTLMNTLNSLFKKELSEQQLGEVVSELCKRGIVAIEGTKVTYSLPDAPKEPTGK